MVNRCSVCKDGEESTNHILIHCSITRQLLQQIILPVYVGDTPSF